MSLRSPPTELARRLEEHLSGRETGAQLDADGLVTLAAHYERAAERWPKLSLSPEDFADAALHDEGDAVELSTLHAEDLYLARCCCRGQPEALQAFEHEHGALWRTAIPARLRGSDLLPEDFTAVQRERLFIGDGEPLLARYRGRGALGGWVRVTIARAAISAARRGASQQRHDAALPDLLGVMAAQEDPELDYLRHLYRDAFREAFESAVACLSDRERSLVHLSLVRGVSVRKLGTMYGVGRSTASRWVNRAVASLSTEVRRHLAEHLGADSDDLNSVMQVLDGGIELSVSRILR